MADDIKAVAAQVKEVQRILSLRVGQLEKKVDDIDDRVTDMEKDRSDSRLKQVETQVASLLRDVAAIKQKK
jgi:hypothetical protein